MLSHWSLRVMSGFGFQTHCSVIDDALWPISAFNLELNAGVDEAPSRPHTEGGEIWVVVVVVGIS